ncbi:protein LHCP TRANSLOCATION DEFECT-like [Curcuma longa]|uniref:protein LHCP TRANSLOCATION DEFECT-like n=1 Tax=Curcuma longa TaxID=136217 RepID=UPI003D9EBE17
MASIPCSFYCQVPSSVTCRPPASSDENLSSPFDVLRRRLCCFGAKVTPDEGSSAFFWLRLGNRVVTDGPKTRDDFDRDDVQQYFNSMRMADAEGSYEKIQALLNLGIQPVDILLMLAASEGDKPKIEELMRAGARYDVRDADGRTALDRAATNGEIKELILGFSV